MRSSIAVLILLSVLPSAQARRPRPGVIQGTVQLRRAEGGQLALASPAGVVVYVPDFRAAPPRRRVRLAQREGAFAREVVPVVAGTMVEFPNQDAFFHAAFSRSTGRPFDLGMVAPGENPSVRFDKPGLIEVFCNLHPQMVAFILVLANPAFAVVGDDGEFSLPGIPPGRHRVVAWSPRARPLVKIVEVPEAGSVRLELSVDETLKLGSHTNKHGVDYSPQPPSSGGRVESD